MQTISNIVAHFNIVGIVLSIMTFFTRVLVDLSVLIFIHLSHIILALNSRTNEIQADTFAFEIGYGEELISGLYIIQKISINTGMTLLEKIKASHPHTADRIENLERLGNQAMEV